METNERIAIEAHCTRLLNEFSWCIDAFDYDGAIALFVPDCTFKRIDVVFEGVDGLRTVLDNRDRDRATVHICTNILVDVVDRDHADGKAYMTIFGHRGAVDEGGYAPLDVPDSVVRFDAGFVRTDAGWRIARLQLGVLFQKAAA
jgi:hypothetical protein